MPAQNKRVSRIQNSIFFKKRVKPTIKLVIFFMAGDIKNHERYHLRLRHRVKKEDIKTIELNKKTL